MMALVNVEIQREVERQLKDSLDKRFDVFSAQFTEQLALMGDRIENIEKSIIFIAKTVEKLLKQQDALSQKVSGMSIRLDKIEKHLGIEEIS